ncbi:MAG TPA: M14 family zinc carboxypeptidase [Pyrinomonadaceae bacterium]|nr:M14 family zinc carboxypeptidase [Pyrinomonadaceae bacterium]
MRKNIFGLILLILLTAAAVSSQTESKFDFYTRGPYRTNVPTPQALLRYDVGDHHTTYGQMEKVIEEIAKAASDRVRIYDIGTTGEYRMQHVVAISAPENISRLDEIKAATARLTDPRKTSKADADLIAQSTPATAWMAYTIHGNESSSFEAFMQVIYQLAASNEQATRNILKNTVVLIVTGENPDGHERFATWYNSIAVGSPDRLAVEHREPWAIWGRVNHYRFNLNRDTLAMTQKESRNMAKAYAEWNPQLAVDHHGQPSQYFFPPTSLPHNPNLPQEFFTKWEAIYGKANAAAFDKNNWDYYVRDVFDAFYPGYWDMYPSLNGAIGMTYETDGGGPKGLKWTRDDGTIVTFRSSIAKHFVASMTTLEANAKNKAERLQDFYAFRAKGMADHARSKIKRVVIVPDNDRVKAAELVEVLQRSNVEVKVAGAPFSSNTAHSYMEKDAPAQTRTFPAGSYIIDLDQPQRIFIKSILEQDTPQDKAFVDENMARFRRNQMRGKGTPKEDYGFYDITAWSLPLALGVNAWWTEDGGSIPGSLATSEYVQNAKKGSVSGRAQIAYVVPYETDSVGGFVLRLLQGGHKVAVATRPLNAGGRNWRQGTFVIRVSRNAPTIHDTVAQLATEMGVNVIAVGSGYSDEGDTSVGGEAVLSLQNPKIAITADEGVDQESYGSIWWTLEQKGVTFAPMTIANIRGGGLRNYNVLILPDGSPATYFRSFGTAGVAALKDWVSSGGTIITVRGASVFAALKDVALTSTKLVGSDDDDQKGKAEEKKEQGPTASPSPSPTPRPRDRRQVTEADMDQTAEPKTDRESGIAPSLPPIASPSANANKVPEALPGSLMRATVDRTTYLNFGVDQDELPVILASGYFFRYSKEGTNALVFDAKPKKPLTISGFVWEGNTEELLRGTSYVIDESMGRGHVILFAEDPFFRGLFRSTTRTFFNSILFGGVF